MLPYTSRDETLTIDAVVPAGEVADDLEVCTARSDAGRVGG